VRASGRAESQPAIRNSGPSAKIAARRIDNERGEAAQDGAFYPVRQSLRVIGAHPESRAHCFVERAARSTNKDQQIMFSQVGARSSNPEPTDKVGWSAVLSVLPAQMPHADDRKAHIAQGCGRPSSHESSHGIQGRPGRIRHSK
jgi:hypothetical protein